MNRNQKEAMIAGLELAERAHAAEMAQARALLAEAAPKLRAAGWAGHTELAVRIEEFLK